MGLHNLLPPTPPEIVDTRVHAWPFMPCHLKYMPSTSILPQNNILLHSIACSKQWYTDLSVTPGGMS